MCELKLNDENLEFEVDPPKQKVSQNVNIVLKNFRYYLLLRRFGPLTPKLQIRNLIGKNLNVTHLCSRESVPR